MLSKEFFLDYRDENMSSSFAFLDSYSPVRSIHHKITICFHESEKSCRERVRQLLFDNGLWPLSLLVRRIRGLCDLDSGRHSAMETVGLGSMNT